ncbi:Cell surface protein, partial [hydrothermal vent metagenome]
MNEANILRPAASKAARILAFLVGASVLSLNGTVANAAGTLAGTDIVNTAQASYDGPSGPITVDSNPVTIKVDELLDVTVASSDPGDVTTDPGATGQVTTYQVTNTGNGQEAFTLTADTAKGGDDFDTTFEQIILDTNGNGVYDPGVDTIYTPGTNDPILEADESTTIFVLSTIPATANDGERAEIELSAVAVTGSGAPGTSFAGAGDGGGDAVVGATGADGEDSSFFVIQTAVITLVKSATVADPFGGTEAIPGATITYQLVATITGSGSLTNLVVSDD